MCKRLSIALNGCITGDAGYPLCYTAYDRKSIWYKIFDFFMFWDKQHCRRTWLARRIHDRPKVLYEIKRSDFKTDMEWNHAVDHLHKIMKGACLPGHRWIMEEHYHWEPNDAHFDTWTVKLVAVFDKGGKYCG